MLVYVRPSLCPTNPLQDASSSGRTSHGSRPSTGSSRGSRSASHGESGRSSRDRTSRNIMSGESSRDPVGGSGTHTGGPEEGFGGVNGLFNGRSRDSAGGSEGGADGVRRQAAPAPPPYHADDHDARKDPTARQVPSAAAAPSSVAPGFHAGSTLPPSSSAALMAPAFAVPSKRSGAGGMAGVVVEDPVYLFTDEYPFTADQLDVEKESLLVSAARVCICVRFRPHHDMSLVSSSVWVTCLLGVHKVPSSLTATVLVPPCIKKIGSM